MEFKVRVTETWDMFVKVKGFPKSKVKEAREFMVADLEGEGLGQPVNRQCLEIEVAQEQCLQRSVIEVARVREETLDAH